MGGKDHTTHALAMLGMSDRVVAITFAILSFVSLCLIYVMNVYILDWTHTYTVIFSIYILTLLGSFFYITTKAKGKKLKKV
ncbi:MAG: hypothetical protein ACHQNT_00320 [Bacteroidia bacterium]